MTENVTDPAARLAAAQQEAAAAQAELDRRSADQASRQRAAQNRWHRRVLDQADAWEASLEQERAEHGRVFDEAAAAGDLSAAFKAWVAERATRTARQQVRSAAQNAAAALGVSRAFADLRMYPVDFVERLEVAAERAAGVAGMDAADALLGERP